SRSYGQTTEANFVQPHGISPFGGPSVITCPKCAKDNQDHYKFCLGCGAELPRENAPKPFSTQTPPHGVPAVAENAATAAQVQVAPAAQAPMPADQPPAGVAAAPPQAAAPAPNPQPQMAATAAAPPQADAIDGVACPQCGHGNPMGNRFCASCGYNLAAMSSAPPAPAAAPQGLAAPAAGGTPVILT